MGSEQPGTTTPRVDDVNPKHLKWLVKSRAENQKVTLELYLIMTRNAATIEQSIEFTSLAQELAAVAFSLWRAVFLSDLTEDVEKQMLDVRRFLGALISHNAIAYQQDRGSREWTFQYYLNNARNRLLDIARQASPAILDVSEVDVEAESAKKDWTIAHNALAKAIKKFAEIVRDSTA
jgi:hypothetical protein